MAHAQTLAWLALRVCLPGESQPKGRSLVHLMADGSYLSSPDGQGQLIAAASHALVEHILRAENRTALIELAGRVRNSEFPINVRLALLGALLLEAQAIPDPPPATCEKLALAAESLCDGALPVGYRRVGSAALVVFGSNLQIERRGSRLLLAARQSQSLEDHALATFAAQAAITYEEELEPAQVALARALIGVAGNRPQELEEARRLASLLPADLPVAKLIHRLRPARVPAAEADEIRRAAEEFENGSLKDAAIRFKDAIAPHLARGDDLLFGLDEVLAAVMQQSVDAPACRAGLKRIVRHLRLLQSHHILPRPARSGIRLAFLILSRDPAPEAAELLVEFLEAIADSGMSSMVGQDLATTLGFSPLEVATRLGLAAGSADAYPTREQIWRAMNGRHALYVQLADYADGREEAVTVYLTPEGRVDVGHHLLSPAASEVRRHLLSGSFYRVGLIPRGDLDQLATALIPAPLRERLVSEDIPGLLLVPDRGFWGVPWAALAAGDGHELGELAPISVVPSLSLLERLPLRPLGSPLLVVSAIDSRIEAGAGLVKSLDREPLVDHRPIGLPGRPGDVLVAYGHGRGDGYEFVIDGGEALVSPVSLPDPLPAVCIFASCQSGRHPSTPLPLGLTTAALMRGATWVFSGLWDLPVDSTARLVEGLVRNLAVGLSPEVALPEQSPTDPWQHRCGLQLYGGL